jgi:hypothetical protein
MTPCIVPNLVSILHALLNVSEIGIVIAVPYIQLFAESGTQRKTAN